MVVPEFSVSFILAVLMTGLYLFSTRKSERRTGVIWLFLMIFLATWAGGVWLKPFGPTLWGIHWLAFVLVSLVVVLFLFILIPEKAPRGRHETLEMLERIDREKKLKEATFLTLGVFFWILLVVLVTAIILRYSVGI